MKNIKSYVMNESKSEMISIEAYVNKRDIIKTFMRILEDIDYKLEKEFNMEISKDELCDLMIQATERYKKFN